MADLKQLDAMRIFVKKLDARVYNGEHEVPVRLYFPTEEAMQAGIVEGNTFPVLLFFHGGGWVTESVENYDRVCARMAQATTYCSFRRIQTGVTSSFRFAGGFIMQQRKRFILIS